MTLGSWPKRLIIDFLPLSPRLKGEKDIRDLRPISLVGSIHKIIIKALALRIRA